MCPASLAGKQATHQAHKNLLSVLTTSMCRSPPCYALFCKSYNIQAFTCFATHSMCLGLAHFALFSGKTIDMICFVKVYKVFRKNSIK